MDKISFKMFSSRRWIKNPNFEAFNPYKDVQLAAILKVLNVGYINLAVNF